MRRRVKAFVRAAERLVLSPLLPAAAVMLIALFTVSLALAEPRDGAPVVAAAHDEAVSESLNGSQGLTSDTITGDEAAILSRPLHPPRYHDRYRFYHRYDYGLRSRFNPIDDGAR